MSFEINYFLNRFRLVQSFIFPGNENASKFRNCLHFNGPKRSLLNKIETKYVFQPKICLNLI